VLEQTALPFSGEIVFAMHCDSNASTACFGNNVNFNMASRGNQEEKSVSTEEREIISKIRNGYGNSTFI
jgi:hypothetical protein